ncbi:MAG: YibE/F family protein [Candidatus Gracilibacteria bacterium]|nr:YibE/F family protein [Candidatus Gracilibacteria bacterium]
MSKLFQSSILSIISILSIFSIPLTAAQEPLFSDEYYLGTVKEVTEQSSEIIGQDQIIQNLSIEITEGPDKGTQLELDHDYSSFDKASRKVEQGEQIIVLKNREFDTTLYYIADKYRIPWMIGLLLAFFALTIFFTGIKGFTSLIGLAFNIGIIVHFIIPRIIAGDSPLLICLIGGFVIAIVSLYCAHGFNKRTTIALVSTLITLIIATILAQLVVNWASLSGTGTEEAFFLQFGELANVNLKGLLLGGIIIGVLGVLDDVTTAQAAAVDELKKANSNLDPQELYKRGLSIGKEHITSLVNTLALAYAGASLPVLIIFTISNQPLWVVFNSEFVAEEVIRTLVGSTALILAVPITTYIAAHSFGKPKHS